MKIKIADSFWKIKLLTRKEFDKKFENAYALTDVENKILYFSDDSVNRNTVNHEVFHVFFSLALVASSDLTMDQTEEVAAEVMGKYAEDYIKITRKIFNLLKKELALLK